VRPAVRIAAFAGAAGLALGAGALVGAGVPAVHEAAPAVHGHDADGTPAPAPTLTLPAVSDTATGDGRVATNTAREDRRGAVTLTYR